MDVQGWEMLVIDQIAYDGALFPLYERLTTNAIIIICASFPTTHHRDHPQIMSAPTFFYLLLFVAITTTAGEIHCANLTLTTSSLADPWTELSRLAAASVSRAHRLKQSEDDVEVTETVTTPVAPRSSGEYILTLRFGTPPQPLPFVLDTGSTLVWFPCTPNFRCKNCPASSPKIPSFLPRSSSSSRLVGCANPKCHWIHRRIPANCSTSAACPPYFVLYGSAATGGLLLLETLSLPGSSPVSGFAVGCSLFSDHEAIGVAGFGRGSASLPSQFGIGSFSYCLPSHRLDNTRGVHGSLILGDHSTAGGTTFTPFLKNPVRFGVYYYVGLRSITVGAVAIPVAPLRPDGNGGTIIDSGTSFTVVEAETHNRLVVEFARQARGYRRDKAAEARSGLQPCFNVAGRRTLTLPQMAFHFDGGAVMTLPLKNYFSFVGATEAVCLTVVGSGDGGTGGPAAILGNYQQQDFYVVYDTVRGRMGFRQQSC